MNKFLNKGMNEQQAQDFLNKLKELIGDRPFVCLVGTDPVGKGYIINDFSNVGEAGAYAFCKSFVDAVDTGTAFDPRNDN